RRYRVVFSRLSCSFFAHHVGGVLILPKTNIDGLSQPGVIRPFGESDFADQFGLQPVTSIHFGPRNSAAESSTPGFWKIRKGTIGAFQVSKFCSKSSQRGVVKSRS